MKIKLPKILLFLILIFSFEISFAEIKNNIVVKVENEIITQYEIKNKIIRSLILSGKDLSQTNINLIKRKTLDFLIQNKLKSIELAKYPIKNDPIQINNYLMSISNNNIENLKQNSVDYMLRLHPKFYRESLKFNDWQSSMEFLTDNKDLVFDFWRRHDD